MTKIRVGSEFFDITLPIDKPWITNVYWGDINGNSYAHLILSGAIPVGQTRPNLAEIWYFRNVENSPLYKAGSPYLSGAFQLLSNCIPELLKEFQHPESPLLFNVKSLNSFFYSQDE